jgi:hypothetical protein
MVAIRGVELSDASDALSKALREFSESYRKEIKGAPSDEAQQAQALVRQAKAILLDSGLAKPFVYEFIEHPERWPSCCDTERHPNFPASEVSCSVTEDREQNNKTWLISFVYKVDKYSITIVDNNLYSDYMSQQVELRQNNNLVMGLKRSSDLHEMNDPWNWFEVYNFCAGDWMMKIIEITTQIEMYWEKYFRTMEEQRAIASAANIKL